MVEKPLREAWYPVMWSKDLTRSLTSRVVMNIPVLLFRKENGSPASIVDICPHRFAPLSLGKLKGDEVECGYHGLVFNEAGRCTHNPHGNGRIPPSATARSFPIADKHSLIWIYTGDPKRADLDNISDYSYLDDPQYNSIKGQLRINAAATLVVDNLMDASHAQYVHSSFFHSTAAASVKQSLWRSGNTIFNQYMTPSRSIPSSFDGFLPNHIQCVDYYIEFQWDPPSLLRNRTAIVEAGRQRDEAVEKIGSHLVTPETDTTCHYFFAHSRRFARDDPKIDQQIVDWQRIGFQEQDEPIIEAVQYTLSRFPELSPSPILLSIDSGPMQVHRVLKELRRLE